MGWGGFTVIIMQVSVQIGAWQYRAQSGLKIFSDLVILSAMLCYDNFCYDLMLSALIYNSLVQVFSLTVAFGLFHGLVLFPVLLSVLGPEDTSPASESSSAVTSSSSDMSSPATESSSAVTSSSSDVSSPANYSQTTSLDKGKRNRAFDPDIGSHIFFT